MTLIAHDVVSPPTSFALTLERSGRSLCCLRASHDLQPVSRDVTRIVESGFVGHVITNALSSISKHFITGSIL